MTADLFTLLCRALGPKRVILDHDQLDSYGRDESGLGSYPPDVVALVESAAEIQEVLRLAAEHRVPVTPRGAGSGMSGGALPVRGGIVLSTERMTRIVELDRESLLVVVEPGLITEQMQTAVEEEGLFYPPDPASLSLCSLGGNVAENAGGPRAFKYGVTREYVLGLEVALMGGSRLTLGRRTVKGVTGYDLTALFVGSEGTLGVTTAITLKLLPRPRAVRAMLVVFPELVAAGRAVTGIIGLGYRPRALELLDRSCVDHLRGHSGGYALPADAGALLLIELDGDPEQLEPAMLRVGEVCEAHGAVDILVTQSERERRSLWETRRSCTTRLRDAHRQKVAEDIVVPRRHIPAMLDRLGDIAGRGRLAVATFGHAGDGNLHVNFLHDEDPGDPEVQRRIETALGELFRAALELGGTLSGEHGIGLSKKAFVPWEQSAELIEQQRRVKRLFDPLGLLNPGKIFPD